MTTPAHEAPLVFPSVAFRPVRLLVVCVLLTALATAASAFVATVWFGIFFDPRDTGAVMLGAIVVAGIITLIPLLRRRESRSG